MSDKKVVFKAADHGSFAAAKDAAKNARGESGKNFNSVKKQDPTAQPKIKKIKTGYEAVVPRK